MSLSRVFRSPRSLPGLTVGVAVVAAAAVCVACWNLSGDYWGPVEAPKAQCEAYDASRMVSLKPKLAPRTRRAAALQLDLLKFYQSDRGSDLLYAVAHDVEMWLDTDDASASSLALYPETRIAAVFAKHP